MLENDFDKKIEEKVAEMMWDTYAALDDLVEITGDRKQAESLFLKNLKMEYTQKIGHLNGLRPSEQSTTDIDKIAALRYYKRMINRLQEGE